MEESGNFLCGDFAFTLVTVVKKKTLSLRHPTTHVKCHMSHVTYHMSHVMCYMSHGISHISHA